MWRLKANWGGVVFQGTKPIRVSETLKYAEVTKVSITNVGLSSLSEADCKNAIRKWSLTGWLLIRSVQQ